jgi:hypothetical protein
MHGYKGEGKDLGTVFAYSLSAGRQPGPHERLRRHGHAHRLRRVRPCRAHLRAGRERRAGSQAQDDVLRRDASRWGRSCQVATSLSDAPAAPTGVARRRFALSGVDRRRSRLAAVESHVAASARAEGAAQAGLAHDTCAARDVREYLDRDRLAPDGRHRQQRRARAQGLRLAFDRALALANEAHARSARSLDGGFQLGSALHFECTALAYRGDVNEVAVRAAENLAWAKPRGDLWTATSGLIYGALGRLAADDSQSALSQVERAVPAWSAR